MTQIYALPIPQLINSTDYDFLASKLSADKRRQIAKYVYKEDAYRSLLGEILIRTVIQKECKIANEDIVLIKNQYGKPGLPDHTTFSFNLSHSGDWVVLIWGHGKVGIDVEEIRPIDLHIAENCFSLVEYEELLSRKDSERIHYFYDLWTLKESCIKAIGTGLSTPLNSIIFQILPDEEIKLNPNPFGLYFKQYHISPHYKLSACTSTNEFPVEITFCGLDEVFEFFRKSNL